MWPARCGESAASPGWYPRCRAGPRSPSTSARKPRWSVEGGRQVCERAGLAAAPHCPPARLSPYPGVTDLGAEAVDGARPVDLAEPALHVREAQAHLPGVLVRQHLPGARGGRQRGPHAQGRPPLPPATPMGHLDGLLVDAAGVGDAVDLGRALDVDVEHVVLLGGLHGPGGALVHGHGVPGQAPLLLQLRVQQVERCDGRTAGQRLESSPGHPARPCPALPASLLAYLGGQPSSACSNRSRARSSLRPP